MNKIKCLVVDDHILLRQGVRRLLEGETDFEVVSDVGNAAEALQKVREMRPDIVLMDIGMSGLSSFDAVRIIRQEFPLTRVVFLTMFEDEDYMLKCFDAGASGYVLKDTPVPELFTAIREVYHGGNYFSPRILGRVVEDLRVNGRPARNRSHDILTPREREVIKLLAEGNSVRKVAELLGLSAKTVEAHKFNLMRKLDIHNKAQLVTYAIQKKIVSVPASA
ncbi:MAG TPA: response regulator transcription factor [Terriglobales bacterium]|nr:response regulator transcription factor [Terriglobales bacterium]